MRRLQAGFRRHLGVTRSEIDHLCAEVLTALDAGAPLDPAGIKDATGTAVRNLGEAGRKRGQSTTLPLALVVVILGGTGSLLGSFVGSLVVGFLYNFGQALFPELAYFVLFLPMLLVLLLRPQGLFGRFVP